MDIKNAQAETDKLLQNIQHPRLGAVLGLYEEVGELAKGVMNWEMYGERDVQNIQEECADIFFSLLDVANRYGIDLNAACEAKLSDTKSKVGKWEAKYADRLKKLRSILDFEE